MQRAMHEEGPWRRSVFRHLNDVLDKARENSCAWLFETHKCTSRIWFSTRGGFVPQGTCYNIETLSH